MHGGVSGNICGANARDIGLHIPASGAHGAKSCGQGEDASGEVAGGVGVDGVRGDQGHSGGGRGAGGHGIKVSIDEPNGDTIRVVGGFIRHRAGDRVSEVSGPRDIGLLTKVGNRLGCRIGYDGIT